MTRGRKRQSPALSGDEAIAALRWLVARGRIRVTDIARALAEREKLVEEIRRHLVVLGSEGLRLLKDSPFPMRAKQQQARRRTSSMTAARRAQLRQHGQYLGVTRRLPKAAKARIKAIREKKGVRAAITVAKRMAR